MLDNGKYQQILIAITNKIFVLEKVWRHIDYILAVLVSKANDLLMILIYNKFIAVPIYLSSSIFENI